MSLRQVKTDKADAYHLGELYYKEDLEIYQRKTEKAHNLSLLTRQHSTLTDSYVQIKLQFQVALDQVFPEYYGVFSDLYGEISFNTLLSYSTSLDVLMVSEDNLELDALARQLKETARRNPFQSQITHGQLVSLRMYIHMLFQYQEHLTELLNNNRCVS